MEEFSNDKIWYEGEGKVWFDTYYRFFIYIDKLMELGKRAVELSIHHKSFEPNLGVYFDSDGLIRIEFYSYCLSLNDRGRHHVIESKNISEVVNELKEWVILAEEEIKELEGD